MDIGTAVGRVSIFFDDKGIQAAKRAFADLGNASATLGGAVDDAGLRLAAFGAGIAAPFAIATNAAADFEAQLNAIASVGGAQAQARLGEIEQAALDMGASTKFSASEAAAGMEELIKAGLPVQDVLDGAAQAALDLAAATGTSVPQAAEIMANALNVFSDSMMGFNSEGEKAVAISNLFAQAANASATDVGELGQAFGQAAIVAQQFGIPVEELVAQFGLFANAGLKGSDAGTSFKTMLQSMLAPTKEQAQLMADLGISFFDARGQFIGLEGVAGELQTSLSGLTDEQRQTALAVLFGSDAVRAASVLYADGAGAIASFTGEMADSGTVADQAATRNAGLRGSIEELRGAAETLAITFGKTLVPVIQPVVEALAGLLRAVAGLPTPIKTVVALLGGGVGVLTAAAGGALLFAGQIGQSITALKAFSAALQTAKASSALLAAATGPLGLAVLAGVAAVGLFAKAWIDARKAMGDASEIAKDAELVFSRLNFTLGGGALKGYLIDLREIGPAYTEAIGPAINLRGALNDYNTALTTAASVTEEAGGSIVDLGALLAKTDSLLKDNQVNLDQAGAAYAAYAEVLKVTGPAQEALRASLSRLIADYANNRIGVDELTSSMDALLALAPELNTAYEEQAKVAGKTVATWYEARDAINAQYDAQSRLLALEQEARDEFAASAEERRQAAIKTNAALRLLSQGELGAGEATASLRRERERLNEGAANQIKWEEDRTKAMEEQADAVKALGEEIVAAAKAQEEATVAAAREQADAQLKEIERGGKLRVKALEDSGRDQVRAANVAANQMVKEAERAEAEIVAAAERTADGAIKAAERAEKEGSRAVERAAALAIREAERTEARTVAAAERQADAQVQAVRDAEQQVVDAAQAQADAQVEAAKRAEEETVAAAERAADAAVAAAEDQADGQIAAIEAASDRIIAAAEKQADRQVEAARRAEEQAVRAAERAADAQVAEAERLADRQIAAIDRRLERAQEAADRELEIARDRIDKQVQLEIDAAQQVYDARADEIDWVADREKDAVSYEFEQQYRDRTRAVEDAADAEIAAIRAAGLTREEEARRILEVERRREDEIARIRYENQQAEEARIREIEQARTAALAAAQAERERLEEEARARAEERLAAAEERANKIKEKAQERFAKREAEINADLEKTKQDAARATAKAAAEAAKARERAESEAAANAAAVRAQQEAIVEAKTKEITARLEAFKQAQADATARVAEAAAARREAAETAAAERVAKVQEEQAAIAAAAEEAIAAELEDTKREAARATADVRREQERIVRDEEKALAKETAAVVKAENEAVEQAKRDAAKATEAVRKEADKRVADAEKLNQQAIRAAVRETGDERKRIEDEYLAKVEAAADRRKEIEQGVADAVAEILGGSKDLATKDGTTAGDAFVQGLIDGMDGKTKGATDAATELARKIKEAIEKELDIASPSKWAKRVGGYVGDGLRNGLAGAVRDVSIGAAGVADALKAQLTRGIEVGPIGAGYAESAAAGLAAQQAQFRGDLAYANRAALAMPERLEATVVIDGTDMGRFVVGTALAPIVEAARRTGTRRESWA